MKDLLVATVRPILDGRFWQSGALGQNNVPARPEWPFGLFREILTAPYRDVQGTSRAARRDYIVYVYDKQGSYALIESTLIDIREALLATVGTTAPSGVQCTGVDWAGMSGDLLDEKLDSNTKYATIRITSSV